jgi:hypothetical protein
MTGTGPAAAVAALAAALGADPGRGDLWSSLATALVAAGRPQEGWDAAVRAVELAPQSAASHRAIGTVAAALGDPAQAESAYRHALLLDPTDHTTRTALARLPTGRPSAAPAPPAWPSADPVLPVPPASGRRRASEDAPPWPSGDDPAATGRRRAVEAADAPSEPRRRHAAEQNVGGWVPQPTGRGGRRRAAEPGDGAFGEAATWDRSVPEIGGRRRAGEPGDRGAPGQTVAWDGPVPEPGWPAAFGTETRAGAVPVPRGDGSRHAAWESWPGGRHGVAEPTVGGSRPAQEPVGWGGAPWPVGEARRGPAVGLPGWLGPNVPGTRDVPVRATRVADPEAWRRALIAVVRVEWLAGLLCFVGLAYPRTAPYTAGLLAGALVVAGAYGRLRWQAVPMRRPPDPDRIPTYAAVAAVATALVIIPAAMFGALTLARLAAVAAVTAATAAAVLLARTAGGGISA